MIAARDILRHPSRLFEQPSSLRRGARAAGAHPYSIGGIVMLLLGVAVFVWLFPELRRYLRMERM